MLSRFFAGMGVLLLLTALLAVPEATLTAAVTCDPDCGGGGAGRCDNGGGRCNNNCQLKGDKTCMPNTTCQQATSCDACRCTPNDDQNPTSCSCAL